MTKYQISRTKIELSQHTKEYKHFASLETDEEKSAYIEQVIREKSASSDNFSDDYSTEEEARKNADSLYFTIREGNAMRFLLIEYCEVWKVEYDEEGEAVNYDCIDIIL